jgi:NAD-dependent SIR2 family protein deacetylase
MNTKFFPSPININVPIQVIINGLKLGNYKNISFLLGAGVSNAAGIPDFRSKQGKYIKIKEKYGLKSPESLFDINFFKNNPEIFYDYLKLISFDEYNPTKTHYFLKLLNDKNYLNMIYTQNIDGLEEKAGVDKNKIVYAHGNIKEAICSTCRKQHCVEKLRSHIQSGNIMYCDMCSNPFKYSVVLFGEPLPKDYFNKKEHLIKKTDLVFIIGTSLVVKPFAHLINLFPENVPKVLINKEDLMQKEKIKNFINGKENLLNIVGHSDDVIEYLVEQIGWT